jgi:hypothetical protein
MNTIYKNASHVADRVEPPRQILGFSLSILRLRAVLSRDPRPTIRHLESLSAISRPQPLGGPTLEQSKSIGQLAPLSAVFVCRAGLPPILTSSLPLLTATASLAFPEEPPTRLIHLGKTAGDRLAQVLHQPTVGFIGLRSDTAITKNLIALVRDRIQPVDVPWLREAGSTTYWVYCVTGRFY